MTATRKQTVAELEAELANFEAQFRSEHIAPGTPNRWFLQGQADAAARERATSPENVARRLALIDRLTAARRSAKLSAAAARRQADPQEQVKQFVYRRLRALGLKRETKTESGSTYYSRGFFTVRISDHAVPLTADREAALASGGRSWANSRWSHELTTRDEAEVFLEEVAEHLAQQQAAVS